MANIEHSTNFFYHVSSFTRHLLDNILPLEVFNKPNISPDIVENLIKECDALIGSLQNFKSKTSAIQINESACSLDVLPINDNVQFNEMCETIMGNIITISDFNLYKLFYCKICDLITLEEKVFNEHCASLKHVEQISKKFERLTVFKCNVCDMVLLAPQADINSIKLLSKHCKLDEHILKLKESKDQSKTVPTVLQSSIGSCFDKAIAESVINSTKTFNDVVVGTYTPLKNKKNFQPPVVSNINQSNRTETVGNVKKSILPTKVKMALKLMKKKLKLDGRLPDTSLHYCNVCDVAVNSTPCYIQHNSSKLHISAVNNAMHPINLFKCDRCNVLITGYQSVIDEIISSDLHKEIDELFMTSKPGLVQKQDNVATKSTQSSFDPKAKKTTSQQASDLDSIPFVLMDIITTIYEKVDNPYDLRRTPSFCFICNRIIDSFNNLQQHLKGKQHLVLSSKITRPLHFYQCSVCLMGLFGTEKDVNNVVNCKVHAHIDQKVTSLLTNIKMNSNKSLSLDDSKVSKEKENTPVENVSKVKPEKQPSVQLSHTASKSTTKHSVPTNFFTFNAKLLDGCFAKSGFCRLCNKGIIISNGWAVHVNCKKHSIKILENEANKNLIPSRCKYCPLQLLGDDLYDYVCMNVHMKLNHPDVDSIDMNYVEINASELSQRTVIPGQQYINSSNSVIAQENNDNKAGTSSSNVPSSLLVETKDKSSSVSVTSELINKNLSENILNLNIFSIFLTKRKNKFLEEGLKQFGGICLLCSMVFEDYYAWLIHTKGASHRDVDTTQIYERECDKCNLSLFGERSVIDDKLWSLGEHVTLDALITQQ